MFNKFTQGKNKQIKVLIVLGVILLITVTSCYIIWTYFFRNNLPHSYQECMNNRNGRKINNLTCSYSPTNASEKEICVKLGGGYNQFGDCSIDYYNPTFTFPKNYEECEADMSPEVRNFIPNCQVEVRMMGAYDKNMAKTLITKCLEGSGEQVEDYITKYGGCTKFFPQPK